MAQLILPSEILSNFEVLRVKEEASLIHIYIDESVKASYKENPEIESKGFCEALTIRDFPIRNKGIDLIIRRCRWHDKQNNDLKAEETRYFKEFAYLKKGVYGDDTGFKSFNIITTTLYNHYNKIFIFFVNRATNTLAESFNAKLRRLDLL